MVNPEELGEPLWDPLHQLDSSRPYRIETQTVESAPVTCNEAAVTPTSGESVYCFAWRRTPWILLSRRQLSSVACAMPGGGIAEVRSAGVRPLTSTNLRLQGSGCEEEAKETDLPTVARWCPWPG